jgi:hypothetical protein
MKMKTVLFMLVGFFCFATAPQPAMAITSSTTVTTSMVEKQSKDLKKEFKTQKQLNKIERVFGKRGIDFSDPVKKWFWFWILGWSAALVLYIIAIAVGVGTVTTATTTGAVSSGLGLYAILGLIAGLVGLFGTISLIVWLIKKNG